MNCGYRSFQKSVNRIVDRQRIEIVESAHILHYFTLSQKCLLWHFWRFQRIAVNGTTIRERPFVQAILMAINTYIIPPSVNIVRPTFFNYFVYCVL